MNPTSELLFGPLMPAPASVTTPLPSAGTGAGTGTGTAESPFAFSLDVARSLQQAPPAPVAADESALRESPVDAATVVEEASDGAGAEVGPGLSPALRPLAREVAAAALAALESLQAASSSAIPTNPAGKGLPAGAAPDGNRLPPSTAPAPWSPASAATGSALGWPSGVPAPIRLDVAAGRVFPSSGGAPTAPPGENHRIVDAGGLNADGQWLYGRPGRSRADGSEPGPPLPAAARAGAGPRPGAAVVPPAPGTVLPSGEGDRPAPEATAAGTRTAVPAAGAPLPTLTGAMPMPARTAPATGVGATAGAAMPERIGDPPAHTAAVESTPGRSASGDLSTPGLLPSAGLLRADVQPAGDAQALATALDRRTLLEASGRHRSVREVSSAAGEGADPLLTGAGESSEQRLQSVTARPVLPVLASRDLSALAERIETLVQRGLGRANVSLNLGELGDVEIRVRMESRQAHVQFLVQDPQVREALETQLPRLRALLADGGLDLGDVATNLQGHGDDRSERDRASVGSRRRGPSGLEPSVEPAPEIRRRPDGSHLLDAFA